MLVAAWIVVTVWLTVYFGSWLIQIALGLLSIAIRLLVGLTGLVLGLGCLLGLALFDRPGLRRVLAQSQPLAASRMDR